MAIEHGLLNPLIPWCLTPSPPTKVHLTPTSTKETQRSDHSDDSPRSPEPWPYLEVWVMGVPQNGWFIRENTIYKWMITRRSNPIFGNPQVFSKERNWQWPNKNGWWLGLPPWLRKPPYEWGRNDGNLFSVRLPWLWSWRLPMAHRFGPSLDKLTRWS